MLRNHCTTLNRIKYIYYLHDYGHFLLFHRLKAWLSALTHSLTIISSSHPALLTQQHKYLNSILSDDFNKS